MTASLAQSCPALATRAARPAALAVLTAAALLSGCVSLPDKLFTPPPPDVASPLAADIRKLDVENAAYPSWLQVPSQPTDVRPGSAWTRNIYNTLRLRRETQAIVVVFPQSLYGAQPFPQEGRAYVVPPASPAQAAALADQTAAFAKTGRARAKPPSPAQ